MSRNNYLKTAKNKSKSNLSFLVIQLGDQCLKLYMEGLKYKGEKDDTESASWMLLDSVDKDQNVSSDLGLP